MSSSNGFYANQRNAHRNANAGSMLKRRSDNRNYGGIRDFQEERNRYAPPQKRARSQTQFRSANPGKIPLYNHGRNMSRVSNFGDMIGSNSINNHRFDLRNNDSYHHSNIDYQKPFGYGIGNPNPQLVPIPLPYRKLNDDVAFDSLPDWVPNQSVNRFNHTNSSRFNTHESELTNLPMNHSNMVSFVSQAMPQPIVSKDLLNLLTVLNTEKENQSSNNDESPLGLDFDPAKLKVRHESVINSLYSDMPRQCSSCGVRFKCQEDHSKHMDWHVRKNRNKSNTRSTQKPKKSRDWFASSSLWLSAATGGTVEAAIASFNGETQKTKEEERCVVRADENQKTCALCVESFEEFFSHEDDEWMYRDAVYLNGEESGLIVHAKCMPETRQGSKETTVASALVC